MEATLVIVTLLSLAFAIGMAMVAWRVLQEERQRAEARVAALEEGLAAADGPTQPVPTQPIGVDRLFADTGETPAAGGRSRGLLAISVGSGLIMLLIVAVWSVGRLLAPGVDPRAAGVKPAASTATAAAAATTGAPLELVALEQTREGDQLTIQGTVRNPPGGVMIDRLAVVVAFFDVSGQQLASVRAPLDFRSLAPGDESPFQVSTALPAGVTRYRVSFRRDEGTIVPHVDRRQQEAS